MTATDAGKVINESGIEIKTLYTADDVAASVSLDSCWVTANVGKATKKAKAKNHRLVDDLVQQLWVR